MPVSFEILLAIGAGLAGLLFLIFRSARKALRQPTVSGMEGLLGSRGTALSTISREGKVSVNGEIWNATTPQGIIEKDAVVTVAAVEEGLVLVVKKSN